MAEETSLVPHAAFVVCVLAVIALGTPREGQRAPEVSSSPEDVRARPPEPDDASRPLDPSRATEEQLEALPGVGPALASRIVEHRTAHGPFRSLADFDAVRGVGPALLAKLAPRLVFPAASPNPRGSPAPSPPQ